MARKHEQSLAFGPEYPTRYQMFFADFVRLLSDVAVVNQVGLLGRILLEEIVYTEDKRRYLSAPEFWVNSLADRCGRHRNQITKARKLCEQSGWLYWRQVHRQMAVAWVLVPERFTPQLGRGGSEGIHRFSAQAGHRSVPVPSAQVGAQSSAQVGAPSTYSQCPQPTPTETAAVAELLKTAGVLVDPDSLIRRALHQGRSLADIRSRIQHFLDRQGAWKPGFLCYSLTHKSYVGVPADGGWPDPNPDWVKAKTADRAVAVAQATSIADANSRARDQRMRQLEIQFDLPAKTIEQVLTTFALPVQLQARLQPYRLTPWRAAKLDDGLRLAVLEACANSMN